jgi:hypothetical protein
MTKAPKTLTPYADDSAALTIGEFTIENGTDSIALHGSLDLTRDKVGLERARLLKATVDRIVAALEGDKALPDNIAPPEAPSEVKNPFA